MPGVIDTRVKAVREQGDKLFSKKLQMNTLWQEIADNFYPERADFTVLRSLGTDFASNLTTSYPLSARRDLGGVFSSMLRPSDRQWFYMRPAHVNNTTKNGKLWMQSRTEIMTRAMYDRAAQFKRATKEGDNDYAAFGQCAITVELNRLGNGMLYRNWHLRDMAWCENAEGKIDNVHRNWKPYAVDINRIFKGNIAPQVKNMLVDHPYTEVQCRHIVVPGDIYEPQEKPKYGRKPPFYSLHLDLDHNYLMEETPLFHNPYVIPRWQTVSGSQYAYSPATVAALPDARLIQAMTLTLLEAGEKSVNPPLIATEQAVRSDMAIYAGGTTWVDADYDERNGPAIRPLPLDFRNLPFGKDMSESVRMSIHDAFYLNKMGLPPMGAGMSPLEVSERVSEYVRNALPLFEPMEDEYNGALCETTFDVMLRAGGFGPMNEMPQELRGIDIGFSFVSPLTEAKEKRKAQTFLETKGIVLEASQIDPDAADQFDAETALRDVLESSAPPSWVRSVEEVKAIHEQKNQVAEQQNLMQTLTSAGVAGTQLANASKAIGESQVQATTQAL